MLRWIHRASPEREPAAMLPPVASPAVQPEAALELLDDDLEHVVGGLERIYIYDPGAAPAPA